MNQFFHRRATADGPAFEIHLAESVRRPEVEQFIRDVYCERFSARLAAMMPVLVTLADYGGNIQAAAGLRPADLGPLFVENYTGTAIEQVLESSVGRRVPRSRVVEVGNLATRLPGTARVLFLALTGCLYESGFDWVVFAGTSEVRAIFRRMSVDLVGLCAADPQRLGEASRDWGSYYENEPHVMAGEIVEGCKRLGLTRDPLAILTRFALAPAAPVPCPG